MYKTWTLGFVGFLVFDHLGSDRVLEIFFLVNIDAVSGNPPMCEACVTM